MIGTRCVVDASDIYRLGLIPADRQLDRARRSSLRQPCVDRRELRRDVLPREARDHFDDAQREQRETQPRQTGWRRSPARSPGRSTR